MLLVKEGQTDLAGVLYQRYKDVLFRFFFNMMQNASLSEDLVQNVFMRILKYRDKFRGDGEFKYWLFAIARNVHADHYRKKGNHYLEDIDKWSDRIIDQNNDHLQVERKEEIRTLRRALKILDANKREVLVLSRLHGMKYSEIGQLLDITEGAVKVRIFRAMKQLKQIYAQLDDSQDEK
jgi:RNA polymerase sigma-70 factor (ECF subfamily)